MIFFANRVVPAHCKLLTSSFLLVRASLLAKKDGIMVNYLKVRVAGSNARMG